MKWIELGEVFPIIRNGKSIKQDGYEGYPITRIETIADRYINENRVGYANIHELDDYEEYVLQKGDILMSHINSVKHLGKTAIFDSDTIMIHGMNLLCLRGDKDKINNYYGYYCLNSDVFLNQISHITKKSVNQASFNITNLKKIKIPVPPMETQEKIVKVLDHAQALIDKRKEQIESLDQLIESIFYTMFGDPVRNEKGWEVKKLEEVLLNNVSNIKKDFKDDISYIDIGSINNNNNSIESYNNFKIKDAPSRAKRILNHGDILFSTVRPNLKNIAIFDMYTENTAIGSTGFCIIRVNESLVNNKYIFNVVKNSRFTGYLVKIAEGASYPAVKDSDIKSIKISIPPISLQNEFAQKVEVIEKQKEVLRESLELLEENYKSIMDKAFKGQLFN
ncbi:restriction endonuclease subunit S [Schnuerera ultunensis]|uniref:Putative type I restriction-modification system, S subunit n=1 Tax=[Clostridium] ultunense Esp TaxID=1288971 RepID=A0A1M4PJP6_9FIRM|nr:restriction endonuclease subunit S [Schnuerera ultunensis]SHD75646.1 putative type I restriction-modification system, S subunit [[Clostridium] ultunense Esp]